MLSLSVIWCLWVYMGERDWKLINIPCVLSDNFSSYIRNTGKQFKLLSKNKITLFTQKYKHIYMHTPLNVKMTKKKLSSSLHFGLSFTVLTGNLKFKLFLNWLPYINVFCPNIHSHPHSSKLHTRAIWCIQGLHLHSTSKQGKVKCYQTCY